MILENKVLTEYSTLSHVVMHSLAYTICGKDWTEVITPAKEEYNVQLLVDGVELDITKVIEQWENNINKYILEKTKELIKEKFQDKISKIEESLNEVENIINTSFNLETNK
ncbi:MAG: hypothetical protein M0R17_05105 [Candidatus Omnitrophica bacterium]|jgi:hypothetical protein|nr:hypothetical protein [Candidatus Omnitrophota bacterium]